MTPIVQPARGLVAHAHRVIVRPQAMKLLRTALANGLPPRMAGPIRFLLGERPPPAARERSRAIERRRAAIAAQRVGFAFRSEGSGEGVRWLVSDAQAAMTATDLARRVSVQKRWGMFLHLCAEAVGAQTILEMGTCVGISGAYLASASSRPRLVTLDVAEDLVPLARQTLSEVTDRAVIVTGLFADTLGQASANLSIDLAYVDGHHDGEATAAYVETLVPRVEEEGLIVLDDIRLYSEMWETWSALTASLHFSAAIDVGRFGLLIRGAGASRPKRYDFASYTGRWPIGGPRRPAMR